MMDCEAGARTFVTASSSVVLRPHLHARSQVYVSVSSSECVGKCSTVMFQEILLGAESPDSLRQSSAAAALSFYFAFDCCHVMLFVWAFIKTSHFTAPSVKVLLLPKKVLPGQIFGSNLPFKCAAAFQRLHSMR